MLLFDIIRDWFVMYIWGGLTTEGDRYSCFIGQIFSPEGDIDGFAYTGTTMVKIGNVIDVDIGDSFAHETYINMGDWLSTTSTIIVMILLCVVFGLMVRWLFRLTSGLLRGN